MKLVIPILLLVALAAAQAPEDEPVKNHFLVEAKVVIDGKQYNAVNRSLHINATTLPSYAFNLSAQNFNKNVTVSLRLFAWYNSQWVLSRQSVSVKITDQRNVFRESSRLLARLLKYNSRRYEAKMMNEREPTLLNYTQVFVSYDPESSLLVSRLEDPEIFTEQAGYTPLADMSNEEKSRALPVNITFAVAARSDAFVGYKSSIVGLNEVASKIKQRIHLISRPFGDDIEPSRLYKTLLFNYDSLKKANKHYNQTAALIESKKLGGLLLPRLHRSPFSLVPDSVRSLAASKNLSLSDSFVPTFYFTLQQGFILDSINQLQDFLRRSLSCWGDWDGMGFISSWADIEFTASFVLGALWIFLDFNGYNQIQTHPGISWSYGYFLVAWLLVQIVAFSLRLGSALHLYAGLGFFFVALLLLKLIVAPLERKFTTFSHGHIGFDKGVSALCFGSLMAAVLANAYLHLWVDKEFTNAELVAWALCEFELLLSEYYYFLVMLPPLLLAVKFKSATRLKWSRLLVFTLIAFKNDYWLLVDVHWALALLRLKEEFILMLVFAVKLIYGNKPIQVQLAEEKQEEKEESKQELEQDKQGRKEEGKEEAAERQVDAKDD